MPIKALPEHGLELSLDEYSKLRAFQGGGWYWDHHHQQTIRECLGEFLPRVEETGAGDRGGALFQHFVSGKEAAAGSQPVAAGGDRVPKGELQRLQNALERLKRKAAAPETDRDARRVIESFALPDPSKDPELYRLYGPPWRRRLLVLWGCEREPGSSVAPFAALNRMPVEPGSTTWVRRWPLLLGTLLLLLLLLLLAYLLWPHRQDSPAAPANAPATVTAPGATVPGATVPGPLPAASPGSSTAADVAADGAATSSPASAPVALPTVDQAASSRPTDHAQPATVPGPVAGDVPPVAPRPGKEGAANPSAPGMTSDASLPATAAPPAPSRGASPAPGTTRSSTQTALPDGTRATPGQSPPSASVGATAPPSAGVPDAPAAPPAGTGSPKINVTASYANSPRDGKVDVSLAATVEGADKQVLPFSVTEWRVDGNPPPGTSQPSTGDNHLKLSLPEGAHRVRVRGTTNGTAMTTEVEMDVQIHSQSDVKVKPGTSP